MLHHVITFIGTLQHHRTEYIIVYNLITGIVVCTMQAMNSSKHHRRSIYSTKRLFNSIAYRNMYYFTFTRIYRKRKIYMYMEMTKTMTIFL